MRKFALLSILAAGAMVGTGCARPGEFGASPAYSPKEQQDQIARNWDIEGKQTVDDVEHALLLKPAGNLSIWFTRGGY